MKLPRPSMPSLLNSLMIVGTVSNVWPPKATAKPVELIVRDAVWIFLTIDVVLTMIPLILNIVFTDKGIVSLMTAMSEVNALFEVLFNLIICRVGRKKLQKLLEKVDDFLQFAEENEIAVLDKYVDRYWGFHVLVMCLYLLTAVIFSCGPIFLPTSYPGEGWYPFSVESPIRIAIVYATQVVAIMQTGCGPVIDITIAVFLFFTSARLELLSFQLQNVKNETDMRACLKVHQDIIRFVEEVEDGVRYIVTKTSITMASTIICGAFPLVYNPPLTVLIQFCCMVLGGCEKLYLTVWPADDLIEMSRKISFAAYNVDWIGSPKISSDVLFMIQRSQKPLVIRMVGFLPVLSLEYFSNFLKTVSSYFMTTRAVIEQDG